MSETKTGNVPKYSVVVVHGICANNGSQQKGFSRKLARHVLDDDKLRSQFWHEAVWEKETDAADDKIHDAILRLMNAYDKTDYWRKARLSEAKNWVMKTLIWACSFFMYVLRLIAIDRLASGLDLALDLPLYLGEPRGQKIRNVVIDEIRNAMKETEGGVVLVGHSLGSVIAYDVARKSLHSETPLKIKALITLGSPLDWVTDIRIAEGAHGDDDYSLSGMNWINIHDDADPVSIREELPIDRFCGVKNISIHSGEKYILAHTCYWENEEVARIIRDEIF